MIYTAVKGLGITHPYRNKPEKYKFLQWKDVEKMLRQIEIDNENYNRRRDHCAIYLGYSLGLRISECATLERECFRNIDFNCVHIRRLKRREKDENGRPSECNCDFVSTTTVNYIKSYLSTMRQKRWLFCPRYSDTIHVAPITLNSIFVTYLLRSGLSPYYSWHSLRHGFGVELYDKFEDILVIRDALGHKSIASSNIYAHLSPERKKEILRKLDADERICTPL